MILSSNPAINDLDEVLDDLGYWNWLIVRPDVGPLTREGWINPKWGY